jgi:hypothetical protein
MVEQTGYDLIPHIAIHPNQINIYNTVEWYQKKRFHPKTAHLVKSNKSTNGKVSSIANRKITKAIDYLLLMANDKKLPSKLHGKVFNFKISFITLTLPSPQCHSDNEIKDKCLNQFIIEARKKWKVRNYLWRAEKQKNGSIHFHVLVDKFVPWSELRDVWNRIVNKLGYVERYRDSMRAFHSGGFHVRENLLQNWDYKHQIKAYQAGKANDWNSPNSTDVHSIKAVQDVSKYIKKYSTKNDENGTIVGRIWSCNEELSNIKGAVELVSGDISTELKCVKDLYPNKLYSSDYFSVLHVSINMLQELKCFFLVQIFSAFLITRFNYNLQLNT